LLLVPIKPDQTAAFEEMAAKLKSSLSASTDATLQAAGTAFKFYKASEPMGANALYVVIVDPAVANTEYDFFMLINKSFTPEQQRDPANVEAFKRWAGAFAAGPNRLNLTPIGGGM
jgi:nicotinic acid phosphoribosyltransferase